MNQSSKLDFSSEIALAFKLGSFFPGKYTYKFVLVWNFNMAGFHTNWLNRLLGNKKSILAYDFKMNGCKFSFGYNERITSLVPFIDVNTVCK